MVVAGGDPGVGAVEGGAPPGRQRLQRVREPRDVAEVADARQHDVRSRLTERLDHRVEIGFEASQARAVGGVVRPDRDDGDVRPPLLRGRNLPDEHVTHPRPAGGDAHEPDA